jgi:single-stranded DNA-binding protein
MNQVFLMGVVDKVEDKNSDNGKPFKEVSVAYTEQGKEREFKTWFRVQCYGKVADQAANLGAGETVFFTGKLFNAKRKSGEKTFYNLSIMASAITTMGAPARPKGNDFNFGPPPHTDDDIAF